MVDQVPTTKALEKNTTNVHRVYKEILRYYKEYGEMKSPKNSDLEKNEFHQRKIWKEKNTHAQKRGLQLLKECLAYIGKQHPNLLKENK